MFEEEEEEEPFDYLNESVRTLLGHLNAATEPRPTKGY